MLPFAYFSHGLLPSVVVPASAAPGFERHAGFCDVNGGNCQEEYRGFGESAEMCELRCLEFPAGAGACTAVEYWHLTKRLPMCKLFVCEGDITRALKAPANNVECLIKTESSNVAQPPVLERGPQRWGRAGGLRERPMTIP